MEGIMLGILVYILAVGGKVFLLKMVQWPVLGVMAEWYLNSFGDAGTGYFANMAYGIAAINIIVLAYAVVTKAPRLSYNAIKWGYTRLTETPKGQAL